MRSQDRNKDFVINLDFKRSDPSCPPNISQGHFPSLDGFRAISIMFVLIGHCYHDIYPFVTGSFGVQFFFVISGFLITTLLLKEKENYGRVSLRKFYIRRFLRIFPVAYLFLLILFFVGLACKVSIEPNEFFSSLFYVRNTSILEVTGHYTGHYWSLSLEEQFYVLFPIMLVRNVKRYAATVFVLLICLPLINYASFHYVAHVPIVNHVAEIMRGMTPILTGSLFAVLNFYGKIKIEVRPGLKAFVSLLILLSASYVHTKLLRFGNTFLLASSLLIGVLILISIETDKNPRNYFYRFLNHPYMCKIGVLSYSLYIWQQIFTLYKPWKGLSVFTDNQMVNLLALVVVSYASYHFYERRFLNLKTRFA